MCDENYEEFIDRQNEITKKRREIKDKRNKRQNTSKEEKELNEMEKKQELEKDFFPQWTENKP